MNRGTAVFLVLLRLAIGWHFAVEGWSKVHSSIVGPTETGKAFSSEGYFREAQGPLGKAMRWQLGGDADDQLLARITVLPIPEGVDPAKYPAQNRIPPALVKDYEEYFDRYVKHFRLDESQLPLARAKLDQMKHNIVIWLTQGEAEVTRTFPTGTVQSKQTTAKRIADYRQLVKELRDLLEKKQPAFGRDVENQRLPKAKAEVAKARTELQDDLKTQTKEVFAILFDVLDPHQDIPRPAKAASTLAMLASPIGQNPLMVASSLLPGQAFTVEVEDWAEPPTASALSWRSWVRGTPPWNPGGPLTTLDWVNFSTRWTLLVVGVCLLLGLFTRFWCIVGALFLLMTYLTVPPFPWLPVPPQQEGTYLFVNKNVIEMLALLALATTRSGRWFGLDAMIYGLFTGFKEDGERGASAP